MARIKRQAHNFDYYRKTNPTKKSSKSGVDPRKKKQTKNPGQDAALPPNEHISMRIFECLVEATASKLKREFASPASACKVLDKTCEALLKEVKEKAKDDAAKAGGADFQPSDGDLARYVAGYFRGVVG